MRPLVNVVCSDSAHPVYPRLEEWSRLRACQIDIRLVRALTELDSKGDMLFLVSCHEIVSKEIRGRFRHVLVVHASDLPEGRGWSPMVWQILEGRHDIVVTLLEAADKVDSGRVWKKVSFAVEPHELLPEINQKLFDVELALMDFAIQNMDTVLPVSQEESQASYYPRRGPEDSRLLPERTIASQFDLLRIADEYRYPCFFDYRGYRYKLTIEKIEPLMKGDEE